MWVFFVVFWLLSDHQFRRVCVPIGFSTQKAVWRSYTGESSRKSCFTNKVGEVVFQNCMNVISFRLLIIIQWSFIFLNICIFETRKWPKPESVNGVPHEILYHLLFYLLCNVIIIEKEIIGNVSILKLLTSIIDSILNFTIFFPLIWKVKKIRATMAYM